ncbi:MAG: CDP-glycerol glycerophosphotransferase family protein [Patescibacteria group bacterium]
MKTIFLCISRGLVCRNILRTGVLEQLLAHEDLRVVLFLPKHRDGIPQHLREEFAHPRVTIEEIEEMQYGIFARKIWIPLVDNFVYTTSTDLLAKIGSAKVKPVAQWWYPIHRRLFAMLSRPTWLKRVARKMERWLFHVHVFDNIFQKYQPSAVFVGAYLSKADVGMLKAAQQRGIPTCGMQKGWDNLERVLIRTVPDVFLCQNKLMQETAARIQAIPQTTSRVIGFPQFDVYHDTSKLMTREELYQYFGIPLDHHFILFGSEGLWTPNDDRIIDALLDMRAKGEMPFPFTVVARPHFSDVHKKRYDRFRGREGVVVDDTYRWGSYFPDTWDPTREDLRRFASELLHASAMLCIASTLALDMACFDRPVIGIAFDGYIEPNGNDATARLYTMSHYQPVAQSGGVDLVHSREELRQALLRAVEHPEVRAEGRARLRETMCGPLDGRSAERVADVILSLS